ncbi:MAG: peptide deformylase [bacterium]
MAILHVHTFPDPVLRETCTEAVPGTDEIIKLADDMLETMYTAPGVGLAAPQVGVCVRMIVVDTMGNSNDSDPHILLNPEILQADEEMIAFEEGCLSLPELNVLIERPVMVKVRFQDLGGAHRQMVAEDLLAVAVQHEMDHLEGRLILDYATPIRKDQYRRKVKKLLAERTT